MHVWRFMLLRANDTCCVLRAACGVLHAACCMRRAACVVQCVRQVRAVAAPRRCTLFEAAS
jgi:hypothetical protein